ncbi:hypothetical protein V5E97_07315 [Singulisphaera sp. Ch08]|uniref:LPS export ABC transporter periplasmic protein LptC n=1 Tax=Singulisphaera sp. Ch08 TaxID=3120278 RepID=A0AAU7CKQ0_9BACT
MRKSLLAVLVLTIAAVSSEQTRADDGALGARSKILDFLKREVLGKSLVHHSVSKIDNGKLEVDFSRTLKFANVTTTERGFKFDLLIDIKQANYDLDESGARKGTSIAKDRSLVERFEIRERTSTGELLGYCSVITNSLKDSSGRADFVQVKLEGDRLKIKQSTVGYDDLFAAGDKTKPGAVETESDLFVSEGRLQHVQKIQSYEVDPASLKRTPYAEPETMVSQEKR